MAARAARSELTASGFALRATFAVLLVFLTINPGGISYYHWITTAESGPFALKLFCGVILLVGWVIYLAATKNALGVPGTLLVSLFFIALFWLLIELGLLRGGGASFYGWLAEVIVAGVLTMGITWSHIQRRLSGQIDTDEIGG